MRINKNHSQFVYQGKIGVQSTRVITVDVHFKKLMNIMMSDDYLYQWNFYSSFFVNTVRLGIRNIFSNFSFKTDVVFLMQTSNVKQQSQHSIKKQRQTHHHLQILFQIISFFPSSQEQLFKISLFHMIKVYFQISSPRQMPPKKY